MKIIHVLNHFLPVHIAGTEVYVWALCKEQQRKDHQVSVVIPNYNSFEEEQYIFDEIEIYKYPEPSINDRSLITGMRLPDGLKAFVSYIKQKQPNIVHFHEIVNSNGISVSHFEAVKATGFKLVYTMHLANVTCRAGTLMFKTKKLCDGLIIEDRCSYCTLIHKTGSKPKSFLLTKAGEVLLKMGVNPIKWQNPFGTALSYPYQIREYKKDLKRIAATCDMIIPISSFYYNILLRNGIPAKKMCLVLQALTSASTGNLASKIRKGIPIRLIFIGRIDPIKGIRLLIDVVKQFNPEQVQLDIFGNITDAAFFEKCSDITKSSLHIRWMGKLQQEAVVNTIRNYSALVLPSLFSEMSPLVVQEAFAAGIPVIGSNVYGIAEQVRDGVNGLLFQFGDSNSLKATIQKIIDNPDLPNSLSDNIKPVRRFEEVAIETLSLYDKVINRIPSSTKNRPITRMNGNLD